MIGYLKGILLQKKPPQMVIDVQGVGYEVDAPLSTFYHLPDVGSAIALFTHLVVREDAQLLYGFYHERERALFRNLLKVSGVGPKLALAILSGLEPDQFVQCIQGNQIDVLIRVPGVGKKTAELLVIGMRDRIKEWTSSSTKSIETSLQVTPKTDAINALTALGYKPADANRMIAFVEEENLSSEALIRLALKNVYQRVKEHA